MAVRCICHWLMVVICRLYGAWTLNTIVSAGRALSSALWQRSHAKEEHHVFARRSSVLSELLRINELRVWTVISWKNIHISWLLEHALRVSIPRCKVCLTRSINNCWTLKLLYFCSVAEPNIWKSKTCESSLLWASLLFDLSKFSLHRLKLNRNCYWWLMFLLN